MYTQQEKAQLEELRANYERKYDISIKGVEGGYVVSVTEIFCKDDMVVASSSRTHIATSGYGASKIVQDIFENECAQPHSPPVRS